MRISTGIEDGPRRVYLPTCRRLRLTESGLVRIFVTGAIGFVGGWLRRELAAAGHEVVSAPGPQVLEITDREGLIDWFRSLGDGPDAVVHLAGMSFAPDARSDPAEAFRVNVAGTAALFEALRSARLRPVVLVTGSSEVYGVPRPEDLPLKETAPLAPRQPYAVSKLGQEAVAIEAGVRYDFPVVVSRSFNHTGPGQRPVFVVPAMARRVLAVLQGEAESIAVGNVDVRRDISDVRDVVRAYRLLLEATADGRIGPGPVIVNIGSGSDIAIHEVIARLCALAGVAPALRVDPSLVRGDDPPAIRADISLLEELTRWRPGIRLDETFADVLADMQHRTEVAGR
jgi:GDP-4-dehydro-6-deoxy-D-mannose reductase